MKLEGLFEEITQLTMFNLEWLKVALASLIIHLKNIQKFKLLNNFLTFCLKTIEDRESLEFEWFQIW